MESQDRLPKHVRREVMLGGDDRHEDGGLINLPTEILHTIMLYVSQDLKDHFNAIAAISTLRRVAGDESFLRALFIHGCSQFFHKHDLKNGQAMIREAALSGYELAIYFYSNLMRILSPDLQIDLELVNLSRDLIRRMRRTVETCPHRFWAPNPMPQLYLDRCDAFDSSMIRRCHCAWNDRWERDWDESVKDPWMCDLWFYSIHVLGFIMLIPNKLEKWPMAYGIVLSLLTTI